MKVFLPIVRYSTHIIVTSFLCIWLLGGCGGGDETALVTRELLREGMAGERNNMSPTGIAYLESVVSALQDENATAPEVIWFLLGNKPADVHGGALLGEALRSRQQQVRRNAIVVLGKLNSKQAIPLLKRASGDSASSVRRAALHSLSQIDQAAGRFHFLLGLKDSSWEVRAQAADELAVLGDPATLRFLLRNLDRETDPFAQSKLVHAVLHLVDPSHQDLLADLLARGKSEVSRDVAAVALAKLGDDSGSSRFLNIFSKSEFLWRSMAVPAFATMDPRGAVRLAGELEPGQPEIASALRAAAADIGLP